MRSWLLARVLLSLALLVAFGPVMAHTRSRDAQVLPDHEVLCRPLRVWT